VFVTDVTSGGAFPVLEKSLAFTEARNRMLATNIANITTPGYRTKQLDVGAFQAALRQAADREAAGGDFKIEDSSEFRTGASGFMEFRPSEEPVENLLFHDGTNARIEQQMAGLAQNAMMSQMAAELLKGYYDGMETAIRGRIR